jgi:hypothetical protein
MAFRACAGSRRASFASWSSMPWGRRVTGPAHCPRSGAPTRDWPGLPRSGTRCPHVDVRPNEEGWSDLVHVLDLWTGVLTARRAERTIVPTGVGPSHTHEPLHRAYDAVPRQSITSLALMSSPTTPRWALDDFQCLNRRPLAPGASTGEDCTSSRPPGPKALRRRQLEGEAIAIGSTGQAGPASSAPFIHACA